MKKALSKKNLWEHTPPWLKSILGRGLSLMPVPWLLGKHFRANQKWLRDAQWWSAERAREYQLDRLRSIIELAYERTTYYRGVFDRAGFHPGDLRSLEDMNRLPTIDKATVYENLPDMCTMDVAAGNVDYVSTGGSSQIQLHFYINASRSSVEYAYLAVGWERAGYRMGTPMAILRGRTVSATRNGFHYEYDPLLRHHYYSSFHMTDDDIRRYLEHIGTLGPCVLHVYPSTAYAMAKLLLETGQRGPENVHGILLESENVYPDQDETIERAFGVRTFSSYGHSEKLVLACQCESSKRYHVWPTYGFFELLDEQGTPVTVSGKEGEIVGTGFINTVVPFIRYRTGDYASYVGKSCGACGREHIVIENINGRCPRTGLLAVDGSLVSLAAMIVHDDTFRNVREYQFHQSSPGKATLHVVPGGSLDEKEQRRIVTNLNDMLQGQVVLDIEVRPALTKTVSGKQLRVIQRCTLPT